MKREECEDKKEGKKRMNRKGNVNSKRRKRERKVKGTRKVVKKRNGNEDTKGM